MELPELTEYTPPPDIWQEDDGKWYHRDESEQSHGPFDTKEDAEKALSAYVKWLEGGDEA